MSKFLTSFLALTLLTGCSVTSPEPTTVAPVDPEALDPMEGPMGFELDSKVNDDGTYTVYLHQGPKDIATIDLEKPADGYSVYLFDEIGDMAYVAVDPTGLGGYILYTGAFELYEVDTLTGDVRQIVYEGLAMDLSDNGNLAFLKTDSDGSKEIVIQNVESNEFKTFPIGDEFDQAGDATFNFDGTKLAYQATITSAEPNVEESAVFVVDLATGEQTEFARQEGLFDIIWQDNDRPIAD